MIISRQKLVDALSILGTAVGNKVMQVADYVQFRYDKQSGCLLMSATDFNAFITLQVNDESLVEYDLPNVFLIDYEKLNSILRASTTEDVQMSDSGGTITIKTNGEYKLEKWANVSDFPASNFQYDEVAKWDVPVALSAWKKAAIAVSKDVTKLSYQGVNYDGNFVASDNRRLSIVKCGEELKKPLLLPTSFGDVIRRCQNTVSIGPNKTGNTVVIVCAEIGLIASVRLLDAQFQKYRQIIDMKKNGVTIKVSKADIVGAIGRLSTFTDALFKVMKMTVRVKDGVGELILDIENKGAGSESIQIKSMSDSNPASGVKCSYRYHIENLIDGVQAVDSNDNVSINFQENGFLWIDEGDFSYLLTPISEQ